MWGPAFLEAETGKLLKVIVAKILLKELDFFRPSADFLTTLFWHKIPNHISFLDSEKSSFPIVNSFTPPYFNSCQIIKKPLTFCLDNKTENGKYFRDF